MSAREIWPGDPFPLGATWDGGGTNFSIFSEHADRAWSCACSTRTATEERIELRERTAFNWHGYVPLDRAGPALRLPRARALRPGEGHRFNPCKLVLDPYAKSIEGPIRFDLGNVLPYVPTGAQDADLEPDDEDSAEAIPKCVVIDPRFEWEGDRPLRTPWSETVIYETHVKGFTMRRPGVREDLRGTYAGLAVRGRDRAPEGPRRHRGGAAPGPPHRRRGLPASQGPHELLGLLVDRLLRAALHLRGDGRQGPGGARVQGHGQGAAPGGHRGDPRRGLQPHRGGQPPRPDALLQGRRQQELLPALARGRALLHGLHGHGQLAQRRPPERPAADHGLAALLGDRVPRRRLPLRPRERAGPRALRRRPPLGVLRRHPPGPDPLPGQADRRAVGRRPGRLPGGQLPRPVVGVERHLPRHDARLLARPGRRRRSSPAG